MSIHEFAHRQNQGRDFLLIDQALKLVDLVDLFFWAVR